MTKKKKFIVAGVSCAVVATIIIGAVLLFPSNIPEQPQIDTKPPAENVIVNPPEISEKPSVTEEQPIEEKRVEDIVVDVDDGKNSTGTKTPAEKENTPVGNIDTPKVNPDNDKGEISIGTNPPVDNKYSCQVSGHHCINAENHAYITNLEIEGCKHCGLNNCVSFYYVSPAGIPMCNPTLCPKYDVKQDPTKYCSDCGKTMGDGSNGTCEKFLVAGTCPVCNAEVSAHTCHSH